mgnify:CR=1 FL=1
MRLPIEQYITVSCSLQEELAPNLHQAKRRSLYCKVEHRFNIIVVATRLTEELMEGSLREDPLWWTASGCAGTPDTRLGDGGQWVAPALKLQCGSGAQAPSPPKALRDLITRFAQSRFLHFLVTLPPTRKLETQIRLVPGS